MLKAALFSPMLAHAFLPAMLGREQPAFDNVIGHLSVATDKPVDMVRVHIPDDGYDFIRNLAASGPDGTVVMSDPARLAHLRQGQDTSATAVRTTLSGMHHKVTSLDFPVNFANLAFDADLDLLVLALPAAREPHCSWIHPTLGCNTQIRQLEKAFGAPANVLKFEPSRTLAQTGVPQGSSCYDLDTYYFMMRNARGEHVALVYPPCIRESPSSKAAAKSGSVGRAQAMSMLEELDVTIVEVSEADFLRRACNSISPEPGQIVFTEPVSKALRNRLAKLHVESVALEDFAPGREFGIHCLTLELPQQPRLAKRDL
ncbi:hypothetical protein GHT07_07670 [Caenimonas koreensis DSM 17982]|uniref:Amidinotransferase n=1 Tax=Caenimonas koreensis DSM 17982 TaxID=1121255 RepID=A0A844B1U3_9BURK|nr:hypothetical protein [Caenimonas koreensis]MRD47153.1 hypothetical protein [Caenimonas koreensis DSM 17982]